MANVKIMVDGALMDGHRVTFKAPCNCTMVEKLKVCYVKDGEQKSKLFTMKDSHCNNLTGLGNLFTKGAYVDVILDTNNNVAYLQNAATNRYLEQKMDAAVTNASKVWVLPGGDTLYYFGYGSPQDNGYIAENHRGEAYVDSMTGEVYEVVEIEIVGGDGTVEQGYKWAISDQLQSVQDVLNGIDPTKYTRLEGTGCVVFYNDFDVVIHVSATGLNLTGGNTTPTNNKVATLPSNITVNFIQVTNSVDVMDSSWTPTGNTMMMMIQNSAIFGRCRSNTTNGVITHTVTIPRFLVSIT